MNRLEYITLKETAEQLSVTKDEVLRMAEQGLLRLYARSGPHGGDLNWRVHTKFSSVFRGDLSHQPQIPTRLASQLLSRKNSSIEVKTVIVNDSHEVGLAMNPGGMFPSIRKEDIHFRQEDIDKCINSTDPNQDPLKGYRTKAINALVKAANNFWVDYDPSHPPITEDVVPWIIKNCDGITPTMAKRIDVIIRSDDRAQGGLVKHGEHTKSGTHKKTS